MAKNVKVKGLSNVLKNLNASIKNIEGDTRKGLIKAGVFIKGESQELTPVDFGILRNSAFSQLSVSGIVSTVTIGYTAEYAAIVHELPMTLRGKPRADFGKTGNRSKFGPQQVASFGGGSGKGVYWQGGENKFLEKAVKRNIPAIFNMIADAAAKSLRAGGTV